MNESCMTMEAGGSCLPAARVRTLQSVRAILYREWAVQGWWVTLALLLWFAVVWVFLLMDSHGLREYALIHGFVFGVLLGCTDIGNDCEEFTFSLPHTRRHIYFTRAFAGLFIIIVMISIAALAIRQNLPQAVWGLVVETGFTRPFAEYHLHGLWEPIEAGIVGFCMLFSVCSLSRTRSGAAINALIGLVFYYWIVMKTVPVFYEIAQGFGMGSRLVAFTLPNMVLSIVLLLLGAYFYERKDIGASQKLFGSVVASPRRLVIRLVVLAILMFMLFGALTMSDRMADAIYGRYSGYPPKPHPAKTSPHLQKGSN